MKIGWIVVFGYYCRISGQTKPNLGNSSNVQKRGKSYKVALATHEKEIFYQEFRGMLILAEISAGGSNTLLFGHV